MTNEEAREHMDMLIAHKDKAIDTHPYFKRCDSCIHSEEQDGSNCYECVKGMADNFEAQQKISYINIDVNKLAKEVAEKALDEITYEGKTVREWVEIIVKQQPSEDCISRAEVRKILGNEVFELTKLHTVNPEDNPKADAMAYGVNWSLNTLMELPSVTPTNEDIKEAYLKGYDYGVKDWFKSKTQPSEDCIGRQAVLRLVEQYPNIIGNRCSGLMADIKHLPPVTPQRAKGELILLDECLNSGYYCSECHKKVVKEGWSDTVKKIKYCPNCGAEMEVEE